MKKDIYKNQNSKAMEEIIHSLSHAYATDEETDFVDHAKRVCKNYKSPGRVYNYLNENRIEINKEARSQASLSLREMDCGD